MAFEIAEIANGNLAQDDPFADGDMGAQSAALQLRCRMDARLRIGKAEVGRGHPRGLAPPFARVYCGLPPVHSTS